MEMLVKGIVSMGQRDLAVSCTCDNTDVCDILEGELEVGNRPFLKASLQRLREILSSNSIESKYTWVPTEESKRSGFTK